MKSVPISVVIPAYNAERFIGEALESVRTQTAKVDEIIVVDNNCCDGTRKIAEDFGAKVVLEEKQGVSAARNRGIGACRNDWIAFLDSDDIWEQEKIEYQWKTVKKFRAARIITCDSGWILDSESKRSTPTTKVLADIEEKAGAIAEGDYGYSPCFSADLSEWILFNSSTMMFHKEVFDLVGGFDEGLPYAQDLEFTYRALARFPVATIKKSLAYIRRHSENRTYNLDKFTEYTIAVIERMLDSPEKYPRGISAFLIEHEKKKFFEKGRWLKDRSRHLKGEGPKY